MESYFFIPYFSIKYFIVRTLLTILCSMLVVISHAQYFQNTAIEVKGLDDVQMKNPWAGGLNNPQFSNVDLNNDGIEDLFIFDRTGNKVLTFINGGTPNEVDLTYDPQYEKNFPKLHDWALLDDYNCDGIADIFTYTTGPVFPSPQGVGIQVYRGYYDGNNRIAFVNADSLLRYPSDTSLLNLYVSSVDIPAIADVNGDGDLDVVTFRSTGGFVVYFENQSKEKGYGCDSLLYKKYDDCWGNFFEPSLCLPDELNSACFYSPDQQGDDKFKDGLHAGSTELAWDNDGDGDVEFLKGDISCNNLVYMINDGTPQDAHFSTEDLQFPSYDVPADIFIYPAPFLADVNNDGLKDLLGAPNAAGGVENYRCSWYWKNTGDAVTANFNLVTDTFLVNEMIDLGEGAYPVFFDADADGLMDMLIGNRGYFNDDNVNLFDGRISFYKNTGTADAPSFKLITRDYANISSLNIKTVLPTFGDIDGDGDDDMISGTEDGVLLLFKNIAPLNAPANFVFFATNYGGIDIGNFSAPQLVDVNHDGLLDLLIGESSGNMNYYMNVGTPTDANFLLQTTSFGNIKINVAGFLTGYSIPFLVDENDGNGYQLYVGSERGTIFKYTNIDGNLTGTFTLVDSVFSGIQAGARSCVNGADVNNDGKMDLLVGNYRGGVNFYDSKVTGIEAQQQMWEGAVKVFPDPATDYLHISLSNELSKKKIKVSMVDLTGRKVFETTMTSGGDAEFSVSKFPSGVYFLLFSTPVSDMVRKIVIDRY